MKKNIKIPKLNIYKHENYILNKLMFYGDFESIKWIILNFNRNKISSLLLKQGKVSLDRKSFLFWSKITNMENLWQ